MESTAQATSHFEHLLSVLPPDPTLKTPSTLSTGQRSARCLPNLLGHDKVALEALMVALGEPAYRGGQLFKGIFLNQVKDFASLTNLSKGLRAKLSSLYSLSRPTMGERQISDDGTRKYQLKGDDGTAFEAVYIPHVASGKRVTNTLCVSSQTGCAVGCKFCFTASIRRNRDLTPAEIIGQVLLVADDIKALGERARITNIVFMGMGEPLLNYDAVVASVRLLVAEEGLNFSTRRVTVSTAGIVPRIYDLGRDVGTQLAISLNATTDESRNEIMPINKKWPIAELLQALRDYPLAPRRRFTIEYVLLAEVNDSVDDAKRLVKLLAGIPVKVNLLPLNEHERTSLSTPQPEVVERFAGVLRRAGMNVLLRTPRGQDIDAACGQLGGSVELG